VVLKKKIITPIAKPPVNTPGKLTPTPIVVNPVKPTNSFLSNSAPKTSTTNYTVGSNAPGKVVIKPVSKTGIPTNTANLPQGITQQVMPPAIAPGYSSDDYRTPVSGQTPTGMAPAPTSDFKQAVMPEKGHGIGYGTVQPGGKSVGFTDKNAEIERTKTVIANRQAQGLDNTAQLAHYKNLTGNVFGSSPTSPAPTTPTAPTSGFDMSQFTGLFDGYNEQNNSRFSALEKMIQEMMNGQKYNQAQQGQQQVGQQQAVYSGAHQFTAPNQGNQVGYTQNNDAMNQTLYKYLNGMWKGGF
jgi:hypothetical protein